MANKKEELRFTIPEATPHTIPMSRLAEYLKRLAAIFGHEERVHLLAMETGSAIAVAETDSETSPLIIERTKNASIGTGPREAVNNYEFVKEMLEEDGYTAKVTRNGDLITEFVRKTNADEEVIGPIWQEGTLDGFLVRIEGVDETIHITLISDGRRYPGETNRERGASLGPLFYRYVRIAGKGRWTRKADGEWKVDKFIFQSIDPLDDASLQEVVARLQNIPRNDLHNLTDPIGDMLKLRHGE